MEDVLEIYQRPYDPQRPAVALDEKPVQILSDTREPIPCEPGSPAKQDHEYKRNGTANIFCAVEPLGNFRVWNDRTPDQAGLRRVRQGSGRHALQRRGEGRAGDGQPQHSQPASFYDAFPPEEADV